MSLKFIPLTENFYKSLLVKIIVNYYILCAEYIKYLDQNNYVIEYRMNLNRLTMFKINWEWKSLGCAELLKMLETF